MQQSIQPIFNHPPSSILLLSVIIPCHDEPQIVNTLNSLFKCSLSAADVEIIITINDSINDLPEIKRRNKKTKELVGEWILNHIRNDHQYFVLDHMEAPEKISGVGSARKYGMDAAAKRQKAAGIDGIIANLDADCLVSINYCSTIIMAFEQNAKLNGASLYYEHRFDVLENKDAIVAYELHLRLYNQILREAGFPLAFQTVGSSMTCRTSAYLKQGGMNRRKAGEDFYFLQKLMKLGYYQDINGLCVYPSSRTSFRVPFGTGKAMADYNEVNSQETYALSNYNCLKRLIQGLPQIYQNNYTKWFFQLPKEYQVVLDQSKVFSFVKDADENSKDYKSFRKRFFSNFDGFKVMKMIHFGRDNFWPNQAVNEVANEFIQNEIPLSNHSLLIKYRDMERNQARYLDADFNVRPLE